MKKTGFSILVIIFFCQLVTGQIPDPPVFKRVSVDPTTGFTSFYWDPSPSTEVDGYIVFKWDDIPPDFGWQPIDTIWGLTSDTYLWPSQNGKLRSESYVLSALDTNLNEESKLTDPHRSMFFPRLEFNPCEGQIEMEWIGYEGWNDSLSHYIIMRNENGGNFDTLVSSTNDTSYIDSDIQSYVNYCYYTIAVHLDGRVSTSFSFCDSASSRRAPENLHGNGSNYLENGMADLFFTTDINSELEDYILIRSLSGSGSYDTIQRITVLNETDIELRDTLPSDGAYNYYLLSMNECGKEATRSNMVSLLYLSISNKNFLNYLTWNNYRNWLGGVESYDIYRKIGEEVMVLIGSQSVPDTTYTDDTEDIIYQTDGLFCYQIVANEGDSNPLGFKGSSRSNMVCAEFEPRIFMPNAFTPNNDGLNEEFKPILSFTPDDYLFIIRNRWGNTLFQTDRYEEAWDGTHAGKKVMSGAYVYYVKALSPDGNLIEKSGQVVVIFPE